MKRISVTSTAGVLAFAALAYSATPAMAGSCVQEVTPVNCSADWPPNVSFNDPNCTPVGTLPSSWNYGTAQCSNGANNPPVCLAGAVNKAYLEGQCGYQFSGSNCISSVTQNGFINNGWQDTLTVTCGTTAPAGCTTPWNTPMAVNANVTAYGSNPPSEPNCEQSTLWCTSSGLICMHGSVSVGMSYCQHNDPSC
jgi:hypothetical protein